MTALLAWLKGKQWVVMVACAASAFLAGWVVNGWRLGEAAASQRADSLAAVIVRHGEQVEALSKIARANIETESRIIAAAEQGYDKIRKHVAASNGCYLTGDDIRILRENAATRRAAREDR